MQYVRHAKLDYSTLLGVDHCAHDSAELFHFICINSCSTNIEIKVILLKRFT